MPRKEKISEIKKENAARNYFKIEGLFMVYMFVHFVSMLIWCFYLLLEIADAVHILKNVYIFSFLVIFTDYVFCATVFLTALNIYFKKEEKLNFWIVYSAFTIIIFALSCKVYVITTTIL